MKEGIDKSKLRAIFSSSKVQDYYSNLETKNEERQILELIFQIDEIKKYLDEILTRVTDLEREEEIKLSVGKRIINYFKESWVLSLDRLVSNYNQKVALFLIGINKIFLKKLVLKRK